MNPFRYAWRNLARHPVRSLLSMAGIGVSAALLLDMMLLGGGLERSFEQLLLSRGYQIRVTPRGTLPFDSQATLRDAPTIVAALRGDPRVVAAGALASVTLLTTDSKVTVALQVYGVDPEGQGVYQLTQGRDLTPGDTLGILIGSAVAARLGWTIDDTVTVSRGGDPQTGVMTTPRHLVVRGVVHWLYDPRDRLSVGVLLPVALGAAQLPADRAAVIMVRVAEDSLVEPIVAIIENRWPGTDASDIATMLQHFRKRVAYFRQIAAVLGGISLLIAVLLIGTLQSITVSERAGEIATLRAIGVPRRRIVSQIIAEGLILTLAGGALGLGLGVIAASRLDAILTSLPGLPAAISFFVARPEPITLALVTLLISGSLAGAIPAWRAATAQITPALREEGT